ncbi:MAG: hemopexin repeat-containing protein [Sulfurovum sp.]|nr:hemopexin repeat-containing protein [Sulfurovum sp.]
MLRKILYQKIALFAVAMMIVTGCGGEGSQENASSSGLIEPAEKIFILEDIRIAEIDGVKEKYKIDSYEDKAEEEGDSSTFEDLLDALPVIATVNSDFENETTPVKLTKGHFYNINIDFTTHKAFDTALGFDIFIQNIDQSDSPVKLIDQGFIDDVNESGEYALNIETLIPDDTNLSAGKYLLFVYVSNQDINKSNDESGSLEDVRNNPYIGGFYIDLVEKSDVKTIEIVDTVSEEYMDLPIDMKFVDGHSNELLGKTTLIIYSTVAGEEPLTVRGELEVDGETYALDLLDTDDGVIKKSVTVKIPTFDGNNLQGGDVTFSYYLDKDSYDTILEKAPDLSVELDSDGIEGKIVWYVNTTNEDIETNDIEETFLISKYLKNFTADISIPTSEVSNRASRGLSGPISSFLKSDYAISTRSPVHSTEWKDAQKIKNFTLGAVDAALDYDDKYVYLFSDDQFAKYNKKTGEIDGSPVKLKTKWPKMEFDSIDAAFRWDTKIYFFSGNKYARYTPANEGFSTQPNIKDYWDSTLGAFAPFDAAFRGTASSPFIYFIKGDQYIEYYFAKDESNKPMSVHTVSFTPGPFSAGVTGGVSAATALGFMQTLQFRTSKNTSYSLLNEGILFKYTGGFDETYGDKKKFAVVFDSENEIQAKWSVPSISAESTSRISMEIYDRYTVRLLQFDMEAGIGMTKSNPAFKAKDKASAEKAKKTRIGAKATLTVFGAKIITSGNIEDEDAEGELDKDNVEEELKKAEETGKEKKKSVRLKLPDWDEEVTLFSYNFFSTTTLPIEVDFGMAGSFKIEPGIEIEGAGLKITLETPLSVSAYMRGGINVFLGSAKVEARMNMIETGGEAEFGAKLAINTDKELQIIGTGAVKFYIRLIQGEFNIIGTLGRGFLSVDKTWKIYKTEWLINREWNTLDYEQTKTILDLKGVL